MEALVLLENRNVLLVVHTRNVSSIIWLTLLEITLCNVTFFKLYIFSLLTIRIVFFFQIHKWVNFTSMLAPCLVGNYITDTTSVGSK